MSDRVVINTAKSAAATAQKNGLSNELYIDPNMGRKPDYYVYLYTISQRSFEVNLPPQLARLLIPSCPEGTRYIDVCRLPHPYPQLARGQNDEIRADYIPAERLAQDICNPSNTTLNQDYIPGTWFSLGDGNNLNAHGVFWSRNNPPTEEDLKAAEARRHKFFEGLLEKARTLEYTNKPALEYTINQDYHLAADYFGEESSWHVKRVRKAAKVECPNCGEQIKAGVAFHKNEEDELCVLDWKRTVAAGKKTEAEVPRAERWWTPEPVSVADLDNITKK
jgi:hypothetical protein